MRSFFPPFNACSFEFQVIGVEDSPTTRSGGRLFCYHVSSQTDVNLRKGERERERERERGRESGGERGGMKEKWRDGVQWRGLKGEERIRSVRAALRTPLAAPSLSWLALSASFLFSFFLLCRNLHTGVGWAQGGQVLPCALRVGLTGHLAAATCAKKGGERKKVAVTAAW